MMINNIQGNRTYPVATFKTKKNNQQTSFKGNISENQNQGMTQEQKTWLAVGLTTVAAIGIGLIVWACSKGKKTSEVSKTIDKTQLNPQEQVKDLEKNMQKHFINVSLKQYNPKWDMVKVMPNVAAPFESQNEFQLYEMKILVPQLLGRREQLMKNGKEISKSDERETFVEYLKLRSEYFDKDNKFDVVRSEVLKNPSDDVVDVETLRLSILANNTRQFLYSDESVEEPHEMVKFVHPLLIANYTAKMLEEFKPKKENLSENEKKYFDSMNKLGAFWHERLKKEASEKLPKFAKIITGEVEAPKCYTKGLDERHDKRCIPIPNWSLRTSLTDMLSNGVKSKWNEGMKKSEITNYGGRNIILQSLETQITSLEANFIDLKNAVKDGDDYEKQRAIKKISKLTSEVLI